MAEGSLVKLGKPEMSRAWSKLATSLQAMSPLHAAGMGFFAGLCAPIEMLAVPAVAA
jgi:hypothetical protein